MQTIRAILTPEQRVALPSVIREPQRQLLPVRAASTGTGSGLW